MGSEGRDRGLRTTTFLICEGGLYTIWLFYGIESIYVSLQGHRVGAA